MKTNFHLWPVAIGGGGEDPIDSLVGDPDHKFNAPAAVAGRKGGVNGDDVISFDSGYDDGGDTGAGSGTGCVDARLRKLNDNVNNSSESLSVLAQAAETARVTKHDNMSTTATNPELLHKQIRQPTPLLLNYSPSWTLSRPLLCGH